jgi:hypothetical protein
MSFQRSAGASPTLIEPNTITVMIRACWLWQGIEHGLNLGNNPLFAILNLPTNALTNNSGSYTAQGARAYNRFVTYSNNLYLNGQVKTWRLRHELVLGTNGFDLRNPTGFFPTPTVTLGTASVANPLSFNPPAAALAGPQRYYVAYTDWQQGLIFGDTVALSKSGRHRS